MQGTIHPETIQITESIYYIRNHYSKHPRTEPPQYQNRSQQRSVSNRRVIIQRCTPPKQSLLNHPTTIRASPLKQTSYRIPLRSYSPNTYNCSNQKSSLLNPSPKPNRDYVYSSAQQANVSSMQRQIGGISTIATQNKTASHMYYQSHYGNAVSYQSNYEPQVIPTIKLTQYLEDKVNPVHEQKHELNPDDPKVKELIFSKIDCQSPSFSNILDEFRTQRSDQREEKMYKVQEKHFEQMQHIIIQQRAEESSRDLPQFAQPSPDTYQMELEQIYKGSFKISKPKY